jgi:hypothetical protein
MKIWQMMSALALLSYGPYAIVVLATTPMAPRRR